MAAAEAEGFLEGVDAEARDDLGLSDALAAVLAVVVGDGEGDDAGILDIDNPVFGDVEVFVEKAFLTEVVGEAGFGDFDDEVWGLVLVEVDDAALGCEGGAIANVVRNIRLGFGAAGFAVGGVVEAVEGDASEGAEEVDAEEDDGVVAGVVCTGGHGFESHLAIMVVAFCGLILGLVDELGVGFPGSCEPLLWGARFGWGLFWGLESDGFSHGGLLGGFALF